MALIKRYSVQFYFLLTFLISWGGIILIAGGFRQLVVPTDNFDSLLPLAILVILAGPSLSGVVTTALTAGKKGFVEYKRSLFKRSTQAKWYLSTLLFGPLVMVSVYLILSLFSDKYSLGVLTANDRVGHLVMGLMTGLAAGFFEEIGWTGFAIPQLRKKYSVLKVGLIVGLLWALWHTLPGLWFGFASGTVTNIPLLLGYFADSFLFLVVYRILMVWVYDKTNSLLIAMIMHGSLTAAARIFTPLGIVGIDLLVFDLVWVTTLILIALLIFRRR